VRSIQPTQVTVVITGVITPSETITSSTALLIDPPALGAMTSADAGGHGPSYAAWDLVADLPWLPFSAARGSKESAT
jgi:hypothetical protein